MEIQLDVFAVSLDVFAANQKPSNTFFIAPMLSSYGGRLM
jgi:hypothetical protein